MSAAIPPELLGRHERRGMAAVTHDKLIVTRDGVVRATWADLGGRWYAEPVRAWMGRADELWLGDDDGAAPLLVRRSGGRTFLVEPRHQAAFDADPDEARGAWIDRAEPGDERGYRAFLQVDLAACWRRILDDLRSEPTRALALARIADATLRSERFDDPGSDQPTLEERSALVEGFAEVDPAALLEAVLDAGRGASGQVSTDWFRVLDAIAPEALPAAIPAALRDRLAAIRAA